MSRLIILSMFGYFSVSDTDLIVIPKSYKWRHVQTNGLPGQTVKANGTVRETTYNNELS